MMLTRSPSEAESRGEALVVLNGISSVDFQMIFFRRHYVFAIAVLAKLDFCVFELLFSDHLTTYFINELKRTRGHIKTTAIAKCRYPFPRPGNEMDIKWFISRMIKETCNRNKYQSSCFPVQNNPFLFSYLMLSTKGKYLMSELLTQEPLCFEVPKILSTELCAVHTHTAILLPLCFPPLL